MVYIALESAAQKADVLVEGDMRGFPKPHAQLLAFHRPPGHIHAGVFGIPVGFNCALEGHVTVIRVPLALVARRGHGWFQDVYSFKGVWGFGVNVTLHWRQCHLLRRRCHPLWSFRKGDITSPFQSLNIDLVMRFVALPASPSNNDPAFFLENCDHARHCALSHARFLGEEPDRRKAVAALIVSMISQAKQNRDLRCIRQVLTVPHVGHYSYTHSCSTVSRGTCRFPSSFICSTGF